MKFNGFEEALAILESLSGPEQEKILEGIKKHQPDLATKLKESLVTIEDLIYLTPNQLAEFIKDIDLGELGYALRGSSEKVREHIFSLVTTNLQKEIEDTLKGGPASMKKVQECTDRVMSIVRHKVSKGQLVLDPKSSDKMV